MDNFLLNHPAFQGMSPEKLEFIMNFASKDKPHNMKDAMPFLIAYMNSAKKQNINFSNTEVQLITEILSKDLPPNEQQKIKRITSLLGRS